MKELVLGLTILLSICLLALPIAMALFYSVQPRNGHNI